MVHNFKKKKLQSGEGIYVMLDGSTAIYKPSADADITKNIFFIQCPCMEEGHHVDPIPVASGGKRGKKKSSSLDLNWTKYNDHLKVCPLVKKHLATLKIDTNKELWDTFLHHHGRQNEVEVKVNPEGELQLACLKEGCTFVCSAPVSFGEESHAPRFHMEVFDKHVSTSHVDREEEAPLPSGIPSVGVHGRGIYHVLSLLESKGLYMAPTQDLILCKSCPKWEGYRYHDATGSHQLNLEAHCEKHEEFQRDKRLRMQTKLQAFGFTKVTEQHVCTVKNYSDEKLARACLGIRSGRCSMIQSSTTSCI